MPTTSPPKTPLEPTLLSALRSGVQLLPHAVSLAAAMCGAFATLASLFLLIALPLVDMPAEQGFYIRLGIKACVLATITAGAAVGLRWLMKSFPPRLSNAPILPREGSASLAFSTVFVLLMFLACFRPATYPWTAPDELHHLIVARNLAEYDVYASGHPDGVLIHFDSYDSVGPSVIVPVAAAMRLFPNKLVAARSVMVAMFLGWATLTWLLLRPVFGARPAALGVALAGTAIGSVYLGRTLYGEVPALMFASAGLLYWRIALGRVRHVPWSILAGACFGLAVLAKTFFVLAAFPVLAVYGFDRLSFRRVPLSRIVWPGATAMCVVGSWQVFVSLQSGSQAGLQATLRLYQHYLMFGIDSVDTTLSWFVSHGLVTLFVLAAFVCALPVMLLVRYDAPTVVLALIGVLYAFWWTFFTPGQIPRYLWYSLAIGGALGGPLLTFLLGSIRNTQWTPQGRVLAIVLTIILLIPTGQELRHVTKLMWAGQAMSDEYALQDFLAGLPEDDLVVTTSWMAQRSANFFGDRYIPRIEAADLVSREGFVLRDHALEEFETGKNAAIGGGRYVVIAPVGAEESMAP